MMPTLLVMLLIANLLFMGFLATRNKGEPVNPEGVIPVSIPCLVGDEDLFDGGSTKGTNLEGISEPIISFVRLLEEQPKRFLISINKPSRHSSVSCRIVDLHTGEAFSGTYRPSRFGKSSSSASVEGHPWVTKEEAMYVRDSLNRTRQKRYDNVLHRRSALRTMILNKERDRLTLVYKGVENA